MAAMPDFNAPLSFKKMHGLGNDFVVLDSRNQDRICSPALARALGDRHTGVGFDQLAEIRSSDRADIALEFWNSDGSRAGACGNATRCVASYMMSDLGTDRLSIQTARGRLAARLTADGPSVNMGHPQLDWQDIPLAREIDPVELPIDGSPAAVGMGNPHCVFFTDDLRAEIHGPAIEHHPLFPEATNVEFAQIRARDEIRMRVWERGAGVTQACGSGACATLVAAVQRGLAERRARIELDGGWLMLDWADDGVWMTGPTAHVFDGMLSADWLAAL